MPDGDAADGPDFVEWLRRRCPDGIEPDPEDAPDNLPDSLTALEMRSLYFEAVMRKLIRLHDEFEAECN